ncbi:CHASE domain-containing protein [Dactylosporangium sucinum]|uniref:CHASE domain-containing protein n=1 Tax=Dactylosporangium sucinum TaxID=1424081 RepID=A0A917UE69_9ACTN|nr:CHASE domain-containing protein [Dactylosporangium sucinum]GGM81070.1 hypothetical protein GCM10007977_098100 [Dactylosporangium sucinum]
MPLRGSGFVAAVTALVAAVGLGVSAAATAVAGRQAADARQQFAERSALAAAATAGVAGRYTDTVAALAAALGAYEPLTRTKFEQAVAPIERMELAGATNVVYVATASDAQIPAAQALWRDRGAEGLTLRASGAGEHHFVVFNHILDGRSEPRIGIDTRQSAEVTAAVLRSRATGSVSASDPYHFIIDQQLPHA